MVLLEHLEKDYFYFEKIFSNEHLSVSLCVKTCKQKTPNFFFFLKNSHLPKNPLEKTEMGQKT